MISRHIAAIVLSLGIVLAAGCSPAAEPEPLAADGPAVDTPQLTHDSTTTVTVDAALLSAAADAIAAGTAEPAPTETARNAYDEQHAALCYEAALGWARALDDYAQALLDVHNAERAGIDAQWRDAWLHVREMSQQRLDALSAIPQSCGAWLHDVRSRAETAAQPEPAADRAQ